MHGAELEQFAEIHEADEVRYARRLLQIVGGDDDRISRLSSSMVCSILAEEIGSIEAQGSSSKFDFSSPP